MANTIPAAAAAVPKGWLPYVRRLVANHGREIIIKGLALIMIWGLGAFAWGSLNALQTYQAKQKLQQAVQASLPTVEGWLGATLYPLQQLAKQPEFLAALQTPMGLAGPTAERALNQWAQGQTEPDLVLFDAATGQTLAPLGTTPPQCRSLYRPLGPPCHSRQAGGHG